MNLPDTNLGPPLGEVLNIRAFLKFIGSTERWKPLHTFLIRTEQMNDSMANLGGITESIGFAPTI